MVKCQAEGLFYSGCCTKPTGRAQTGTFTSHGSEVGASFQVPAAFLPSLPVEFPMNSSAPKHHPKAPSPVPSRCKLGLQCRNQRGRKHAVHRGDYGDCGVGALPAGLDGRPLAELCLELHGLWARAQVGILGLPVVSWVIAG